MPSGPETAFDRERVAQLVAYDILDTPAEEAFDDLVCLAAMLLEAPIALVSLVDAERQWFKARLGLDVDETPRSEAFCDWAIRDPDAVMVVPDARLDPRFVDNPLVTGDPHIRFYAGAPLRSRKGAALGTVCVIDREPRSGLSDQQQLALRMVARQAERQFELRLVTAELERSELRLKTLVEQSADLVLILTDDGTITFASAAAADMLGIEPAAALGTNALGYVHPDDLANAAAALAETAATPGFNVPVELRVEHAGGGWRHVEIVANNQLHDPALNGIVLHVRDVTFRKEVEERVRQGERQLDTERRFLRAVLDNLEDGVVACKADGALSLFNPAAERLHSATFHQMAAGDAPARYHLYAPDGVTPLAPEDVPLARALAHGKVSHQEIVIAPPNLPPRLVSCTGHAILDGAGERLGAVVAMHNITAQRRNEEALRRLANHDILTGLPNRAVFSNRLEAALARQEPAAVLFVDLDNFKHINDEHGHNTGDRVLATMAERIKASVKDDDTPARLGGDEFVVLCRNVATGADAAAIAARLRTALAAPIKIGDLVLHSGGSVGWALPEPHERDPEALLARADQAMYADKQRRRSD